MKRFAREIRIAVTLLMAVCVLASAYTLFVTLVARTVMPGKANGSLLLVDGRVVGSEFIGQSFTSPGYFHGRPSTVDYDSIDSGGSNYGPTSAEFMALVGRRIEQVRRENGLPPGAPIPADLVLASGSGLDPDISVEAANIQVSRVAASRGLPEAQVKALLDKHVESPELDFLGQARVNVLKLNIALDELAKIRKP